MKIHIDEMSVEEMLKYVQCVAVSLFPTSIAHEGMILHEICNRLKQQITVPDTSSKHVIGTLYMFDGSQDSNKILVGFEVSKDDALKMLKPTIGSLYMISNKV